VSCLVPAYYLNIKSNKEIFLSPQFLYSSWEEGQEQIIKQTTEKVLEKGCVHDQLWGQLLSAFSSLGGSGLQAWSSIHPYMDT
jgi:hypothetical protein